MAAKLRLCCSDHLCALKEVRVVAEQQTVERRRHARGELAEILVLVEERDFLAESALEALRQNKRGAACDLHLRRRAWRPRGGGTSDDDDGLSGRLPWRRRRRDRLRAVAVASLRR